MALSWNEIKQRAIAFSKNWEHASDEDAEAKSFMDGFFEVFGVSRRRYATFEQKVTKLGDKQGFIDLLWKGVILIEFKSRGKDLDKAHKQATDYFPGLQDHELPRYILVSDFARFRLYDLEEKTTDEFLLKDLYKNVRLFGFMAGYVTKKFKDEEQVNIQAAELMGKLHDRMKAVGYEGHVLENYLVRLLFCLFADDTTIFEKNAFHDYLDNKTSKDGSDLAAHLAQLFYVLNTPKENRLKILDEDLAAFPYVNGKLFEETLPPASFDSGMRQILLDCCQLNWGMISPAIFGSLFQSVMDEKARRNLGAHYTSEKNILKVIKPLFLDDLWEEYSKCQDDKNKHKKLHDKISKLRFLDPACGCGNFLIIAYRELRLLELEIVGSILKGQTLTDIHHYFTVDVDQFYGIELEEFPAQIAMVALWLIDHQMNLKASELYGEYFNRLPLRKSATIIHGNALRVDWDSIIPAMPWDTEKPNFNFILGNPPFIGSKIMSQEQRDDIINLFDNADGSGGVLDYVTGWYIKAAKYIQGTKVKVGFVSTNSIVQGEQVGILWGQLLHKYHIKIHFAHRTFKWRNEAKGNAAVYCVIIGFATFNNTNKVIYDYEDIKGEPHELKASNINPYLVDAKDILISKKSTPICKVPKMSFGNMPLDGGHLLLTDEEKQQFVIDEPQAIKYIKPLISAYEFLNGGKRWCLWLVDVEPKDLKQMPGVIKRIDLVRKFRLESKAPSTRKFAATPTLFRDRNQPKSFILIPSTTSENRKYIPLGFFGKNDIANNSCHIIPDGKLFHFGVMMSVMHMTWVKYVCGRLESRFRYSKDIVYNNFPWPENPTQKQTEAVEAAAQAVLDARAQFPESSLADLYDPLTMPPALVKAHQQLDKAVDLCYRPQPFPNETKRIEFLFELYEKYTAGLFGNVSKKGGKRK